ncbi:hypothetical protein [Nocardiopsis sp. NPDC058789]|uniref:hypothetical protein n=1 Tax=Nocardiopsis sp. NPDC058789 TaxID=3346634 RepID=UPI003672137C
MDTTTRDTFAQRVRSSFGLRDPHIAAVVDADLDSSVPWAATERPLGPNLSQFVRAHGPLPAAALHGFALATALGLVTLHSAQRAHGTLRPEGIVLTNDRALLADPGLVPATDDESQDVFDPREGRGTEAGDVFSWAAILCFASSGIEGPDGLDHLPQQLRGVVDACLRENPDLRPSADDLVTMLGGTVPPWPPELGAAIEEAATAIRVVSTEQAASGDRRRFLVFASGILGLTLVASLGAFWGIDRTTGNTSAPPDLGGDSDCSAGSAFPEPTGPVTDLDAMQVDFSPDGEVLAVGSFNHGLTLWDWREGEEFARPVEDLNGLGPMSFVPVGCTIAATSLQRGEGQERPYRLTTTYDLPSGEAKDHPGAQPDPHPDGSQKNWSVVDLAFSTDGRRMALSNRVSVQGSEPPVHVVDLDSGGRVAALGQGPVPTLAFLDQTRVAAHTRDSIEIWDTETGETLQSIRNVTEPSFAVTPEENQVLSVRNENVILFDLDSNTEKARFPTGAYADEPEAWINHLGMDSERGLVHFSWGLADEDGPDNLGTDRENETHGHLWDVETGENLLEDDGLMTRPVAFHPEVIAAVNQDGDVDLLDPDTLEVIDVIG